MNIDFKLKIPLINQETNEVENYNISTQLLLTPMYAMESDVLTPFTGVKDDDLHWIRKELHNASLTVYRLSKFLEKSKIIKEEDLFLIRRDFTICLVTNAIAKQLNKNIAASVSRAKTLGDFSVSTSNKGDNSVLLQIIKDSADCIEEMKATIEDLEQSMVIPATFVKGRYNPKTKIYGRLWWNDYLSPKISDGYGSQKYFNNGSLYKAGSFNRNLIKSSETIIDYYLNNNGE